MHKTFDFFFLFFVVRMRIDLPFHHNLRHFLHLVYMQVVLTQKHFFQALYIGLKKLQLIIKIVSMQCTIKKYIVLYFGTSFDRSFNIPVQSVYQNACAGQIFKDKLPCIKKGFNYNTCIFNTTQHNKYAICIYLIARTQTALF